MVKMTEKEWTKCMQKNADRLDDKYYKKLDQKIKKEHTYVDRKKMGDRWNYMGNGNWTTNNKIWADRW